MSSKLNLRLAVSRFSSPSRLLDSSILPSRIRGVPPDLSTALFAAAPGRSIRVVASHEIWPVRLNNAEQPAMETCGMSGWALSAIQLITLKLN
eukprot:764153-Hanusia_phi.AAC.8